jgi:hypothetical protein
VSDFADPQGLWLTWLWIAYRFGYESFGGFCSISLYKKALVSFGVDFNTKLMQILNGGNLKQIVY